MAHVRTYVIIKVHILTVLYQKAVLILLLELLVLVNQDLVPHRMVTHH